MSGPPKNAKAHGLQPVGFWALNESHSGAAAYCASPTL